MAIQGRFIPKNPSKYIGNVNRVIFRSSWELTFFKWLDQNAAVLRWGSEEFSIPYLSPLDRRMHRYFPDVIVYYKHQDGSVRKEIVEIKPFSQTVKQPRMSERDAEALVVNEAKWEAATKFAASAGAKFRVITERTMFAGVRKHRAPAMGRAV